MAIKMVQKPVNVTSDKQAEAFISKGGSIIQETNDDHRLTLRIPRDVLNKIDVERKKRVGRLSRNLWILETIESRL